MKFYLVSFMVNVSSEIIGSRAVQVIAENELEAQFYVFQEYPDAIHDSVDIQDSTDFVLRFAKKVGLYD